MFFENIYWIGVFAIGGSCGPDDLEAAIIDGAVQQQGYFNPDGSLSLRDSKVREQLVLACGEQANLGELCPPETFQRTDLGPVRSPDELAQQVAEVLLPGGLRRPDPEIDSARGNLPADFADVPVIEVRC